jgi:hypothetical protein
MARWTRPATEGTDRPCRTPQRPHHTSRHRRSPARRLLCVGPGRTPVAPTAASWRCAPTSAATPAEPRVPRRIRTVRLLESLGSRDLWVSGIQWKYPLHFRTAASSRCMAVPGDPYLLHVSPLMSWVDPTTLSMAPDMTCVVRASRHLPLRSAGVAEYVLAGARPLGPRLCARDAV